MSDVVIHTENLGKKYVIGHEAQAGLYVAPGDVLMPSQVDGRRPGLG